MGSVLPLSLLLLLLQVQRRAGVRARDDDGDLIVGGFSDAAGALLARKLSAAAAGRATGDEVDAARCETRRFIALLFEREGQRRFEEKQCG